MPRIHAVQRFKSELSSWTVDKLVTEADRDLPDGDRVIFASCLLGRSRSVSSVSALEIMRSLRTLLSKRVVGWPSDSAWDCWGTGLRMEFPDEDSESGNGETGGSSSLRLSDRGVLRLLVRLMELFPLSRELQQQGCYLLSVFDGSAELPQCCTLVLVAMETFPDAARLQKNGCRAIGSLWLSESHRQRLLSLGAVQAISAAMEKHPESLTLQRIAIDVFHCLFSRGAREGQPQWDASQEVAAMSSLLWAAEKHLGRPPLQFLTWYAIHEALDRPRSMLSFLESGGMVMAFRTLTKYSSDAACDGWIGLRVSALAAVCLACADAEGQRHVQECHAELLLETLENETCHGVIKICGAALAGLATEAGWARWLARRKAAAGIVRAMHEAVLRAGGAESELACRKVGCAALAALSRFGLDSESSLLMLQFVLRSMTVRPEHFAIQFCGVSVLTHLSLADVQKASALGACDAVVAAMRAHEGEDMQIHGCRALATLCAHAPNKAVLAQCQVAWRSKSSAPLGVSGVWRSGIIWTLRTQCD